MGNVCSVDTLNKGAIHILGRTELDGARLHRAIQNSMQFKPHELFISGISYLIYLE